MERHATATLQVETPESVAFDFELANIGSRGLAIVLDTLLLAAIVTMEVVVFAAVASIGFAVSSPEQLGAWSPWIAAAGVLVVFLTGWGYFVIAEVAGNGRTPGKRALGIRVVRDDGSRIGLADSMIRNVLRIVDVLPGNYAVGIMSVVMTARHKRLGDMAAGTVVVREVGRVVIDLDPGDRPAAEALAREYLLRRNGMTEAAREQVAAEVLRALGEEPGPDWDEPVVAGRLADIVGMR